MLNLVLFRFRTTTAFRLVQLFLLLDVMNSTQRTQAAACNFTLLHKQKVNKERHSAQRKQINKVVATTEGNNKRGDALTSMLSLQE